ncbi:MAG: bifunctional glutamate N-acetyltransferase/amino-acid acetyltransferase ArgJ [Cellulomonadaceae bacterium]|jgi:glutamate N-acetyltransferase/amino-acid N-acetyltransferase|nr:bifunctional glutamate N-acetyltransferase/amino-acid acetyltransferase ArgJ [Cellulomonadaceae bacterium]
MSVVGPLGFEASGVAAGLKTSTYKDMALVLNTGPSAVAAAVFTKNRFFAAPVAWSREVVSDGRARGVVINSGGANACTGSAGFADCVAEAEHCQVVLSQVKGIQVGVKDILVLSTGIIGERLPMPKILSGISDAVVHLGRSNEDGTAAAHAIMTTDNVPKEVLVERNGWSVGGMAKGAGMLAPALATMLVILTTDACVDADTARAALHRSTELTFDRLDSDGCMSTNDTVVLLASGSSGVTPSYEEFQEAVATACAELASKLISDAEGSTHDIEIQVRHATSIDAALAVARAVSRSNLVKTAIFGNDPNWGRILAAVGTVPYEVAPFESNNVSVTINGVRICQRGAIGEPRDRVNLLHNREVQIVIDLGAGDCEATLLTNDLSHDYVQENSYYTT